MSVSRPKFLKQDDDDSSTDRDSESDGTQDQQTMASSPSLSSNMVTQNQNAKNNNLNILNNNNNSNDINANTLNHQNNANAIANFNNHQQQQQQIISNNNWWAPPLSDGGTSGRLTTTGGANMNSMNGGQQLVVEQQQQSGALLPKAILKCRANSHPFQTRTLTLIPNVETKVGRAVARHPVSDTNAIFDCKVLSRNHAVLWYNDDKFYIRDTGSSNGTFVNNQRLSQTCLQSDKFEICSGDIVQFGVDVIENARKETHGCIVATIRLYLPDGRETKASQLTGISTDNGNGLGEDLYRLHQFIQEAIVREQMLEVKMNELQRLLELTKLNVESNWQAMVDEDRLLNRIDILENKVHGFQKNATEEKLRDEMRQLQDDKLDYQHAAKEALRRVYIDRYEAVQKLSVVELALRNTEEEASFLRDKFLKSESTLNDTITRLSTVQQKYEELQTKFNDLESKVKLYENIQPYERENNEANEEDHLAKLFVNSDLKNIEGAADIINSICNANEEDGPDYFESESAVEKFNSSSMGLKKGLLEEEEIQKYPKILYKLHVVDETLNKLELPKKNDLTNRYGSDNSLDSEGDDNLSTTSTLRYCPEEEEPNMRPITRENLQAIVQQLRDVYVEILDKVGGEPVVKLHPQLECEKAENVDRESESKTISMLEEKIVQLEQEKESLSVAMAARPTNCEMEEKKNLIDDLQLELLTVKSNVTELRDQLKNSSTQQVHQEEVASKGKPANRDTSGGGVETVTAFGVENRDEEELNQLDAKFITDPMVELEEELVLYKEKFMSLSQTNIGLQSKIEVLQSKCSVARKQSMLSIFMYVGPALAILSYFLFGYSS